LLKKKITQGKEKEKGITNDVQYFIGFSFERRMSDTMFALIVKKRHLLEKCLM